MLSPTEKIDLESEGRDNNREIPFSFTGSASEYFPIWLSNIALTILTLGIYGAWAKVRREKYFHEHTHLAGSSFEYTASSFSTRLLV